MNLQILRTKHPPEIYHHQISRLIAEENYLVRPEDIRDRIERLPPDDRLLLAVDGENRLGFAHLSIRNDLVNEETAEVSAIIVDQSSRRDGIGTRLIAAAETWAKQSGRARLLLKTDVVRTPAHAFFSALGYEKDSTTLEFVRDLEPGEV